LRYLKGLVSLGVMYTLTGSSDFIGYCDANLAVDRGTKVDIWLFI